MKQASLLISMIALVAVIVLFFQGSDVTTTPRTYSPVAPPAMEGTTEAGKEEHMEIAVVMGRIQRYHQKFWLATRAGNAPLADFYLHEMEEAMEEVAGAGIVEEGVDISSQMRTYGLSMTGHLRELLAKEGIQAMHNEAGSLVNSCNACHKTTGHEMIRIREPLDLVVPDQDMAPLAP